MTLIDIEELTVEDLPLRLVKEIAREAIEQYQELQREADEDPDHPDHWGAARAARYSDEDETARAAFAYPSDSDEDWRMR